LGFCKSRIYSVLYTQKRAASTPPQKTEAQKADDERQAQHYVDLWTKEPPPAPTPLWEKLLTTTMAAALVYGVIYLIRRNQNKPVEQSPTNGDEVDEESQE
jgi:hypothetical protein